MPENEVQQEPQTAGIQFAQGIDVDRRNHRVDWPLLRAQGIIFTYIKATESDLRDPHYFRHHDAAGSAGMLRGSYHIFQPGVRPEYQVKVFVNSILEGELPPVLSVAREGTTGEEVLRFFWEFTRFQNIPRPMIRTIRSLWHKSVSGEAVWASDIGLWIVDNKVETPVLPFPWSRWLFWSYDADNDLVGVDGMPGLVYFNGNDWNLKRYFGRD